MPASPGFGGAIILARGSGRICIAAGCPLCADGWPAGRLGAGAGSGTLSAIVTTVALTRVAPTVNAATSAASPALRMFNSAAPHAWAPAPDRRLWLVAACGDFAALIRQDYC